MIFVSFSRDKADDCRWSWGGHVVVVVGRRGFQERRIADGLDEPISHSLSETLDRLLDRRGRLGGERQSAGTRHWLLERRNRRRAHPVQHLLHRLLEIVDLTLEELMRVTQFDQFLPRFARSNGGGGDDASLGRQSVTNRRTGGGFRRLLARHEMLDVLLGPAESHVILQTDDHRVQVARLVASPDFLDGHGRLSFR